MPSAGCRRIPASPALLVTLARLARAQGQWPQAEATCIARSHRARTARHGKNSATASRRPATKPTHACATSNALRASRGEATQELPGRDLRQKIFDQAVVEERNEHGVPRLRG